MAQPNLIFFVFFYLVWFSNEVNQELNISDFFLNYTDIMTGQHFIQ